MSLDSLDSIGKNFFEKLFEKTIMFAAVKNSIKLLEISISRKLKENEFL